VEEPRRLRRQAEGFRGPQPTLAQVSKGGDAAKTKAAFFDMANTCKACHDKYKED